MGLQYGTQARLVGLGLSEFWVKNGPDGLKKFLLLYLTKVLRSLEKECGSYHCSCGYFDDF